MNTKNIDQPIPYLVNDLPIAFRVRVDTPSPELRAFVVPRLGIAPCEAPCDRSSGELPAERPSEPRLSRVA